jgi:hypothetical protein
MSLTVLALACTVSACASGPHASSQQKRTVAGILQPPGHADTQPSRGGPSVTPTTAATDQPTTSPTTTTAGAGSSPSPTSPPTSAAGASAAAGTAPDEVGQSLTSAETQLQAAGYTTAAHPWAATCSTPNLVMQQVPPQNGNVQLYYCA